MLFQLDSGKYNPKVGDLVLLTYSSTPRMVCRNSGDNYFLIKLSTGEVTTECFSCIEGLIGALNIEKVIPSEDLKLITK